MARDGIISGWRLYWVLTLGLGAMSAMCVAAAGGGPDGIRLIIRATARASLALFLIAFVAGALTTLWPGPMSRWIRANRRQFGLAFATSHLVHAVVIIALATTAPAIFWSLTNPASIITGSIAYLFIAALAVTSFDGAVKWLGPSHWRQLHWWGVWVVAISFIFTNGKRIPISGWYALPVALVLAAIALRFVAVRSARHAGGI
jgi:methionine sulfoxide reductase heme-binding subunit